MPPPALLGAATSFVVLVALAYHALPHLASMGGDLTPQDARGLMVSLTDFVPVIGGFDLARWAVPGASAWLWQPLGAGIATGVMRLVALNSVKRDALSAAWIASMALLVDTATWVFMGRRLASIAYTAEEGATLVALLKVEGGALLALVVLLSMARKLRRRA